MTPTFWLAVRDDAIRSSLRACLDPTLKLLELDEPAGLPPIDLCIVDPLGLETHRIELLELKRRQTPRFLPVLLVLQREALPAHTAHLGQSVDEIITLPIDCSEFQNRLRQLLRARSFSQGRETCPEPVVSVSATELRCTDQPSGQEIEAAPFPVMIHAEDGEVLALSRAWTNLSGYERQEIPTLELWTAKAFGEPPAASPTGSEAPIESAVDQNCGERVVRCRDGSLRCWDFSSIGFGRLADGRRTFITMATDVTERKQTEAQLRKLAQAVEQSPESIVITNQAPEIEYVNQAFQRTTGYRLEEVRGQNPRILHSGRTPKETYDDLWATLTSGNVWKGEFINRRKDGSEYIELAIIAPLRQPDGSISHYIAVKEDITERKRLHEELDAYRQHLEELVEQRTAELQEARQAAEAANIAKSAFLANMSHEIRTPMNAIVGLAHLMRKYPLDDVQRDRLDKIVAASEHLLALISDILDLSKIEAGKLVLHGGEIHLVRLLENVVALVSERAEQRGLELSVEVQAELRASPVLHGDATRLQQALLNYLGNAIKFTEQGFVQLRASIVEGDAEALLVRFEVEDSGCGIAPENYHRLFDAFEQIDASATRRVGGTGLGLAITRRLAELMGGEVGVESQVGKGSRFWFTARLARLTGASPPTAKAVPEDTSRLPLRGAHVLLVEDNPINQEVARDLLRDAGVNVELAEDGAIAVCKALTTAFDAILMDVQMPVLDGIAAAREIRRLPGRAETPIIAMTANAFWEVRQACLDAGMNDYIAKPVEPQQLYRTLRRWLPQQTEPSPAPGTQTGAEP